MNNNNNKDQRWFCSLNDKITMDSISVQRGRPQKNGLSISRTQDFIPDHWSDGNTLQWAPARKSMTRLRQWSEVQRWTAGAVNICTDDFPEAVCNSNPSRMCKQQDAGYHSQNCSCSKLISRWNWVLDDL